MRSAYSRYTQPAPTPSKTGLGRSYGKENSSDTPVRESGVGLSGGGARRVLVGKPARTTTAKPSTLTTAAVIEQSFDGSAYAQEKYTAPVSRRPLLSVPDNAAHMAIPEQQNHVPFAPMQPAATTTMTMPSMAQMPMATTAPVSYVAETAYAATSNSRLSLSASQSSAFSKTTQAIAAKRAWLQQRAQAQMQAQTQMQQPQPYAPTYQQQQQLPEPQQYSYQHEIAAPAPAPTMSYRTAPTTVNTQFPIDAPLPEPQQTQHYFRPIAPATSSTVSEQAAHVPIAPAPSAPAPVTAATTGATATTMHSEGLSRTLELQRRVEQLEKEKLELSIAIAPLEDRLRDKERRWVLERQELAKQTQELDAKLKELNQRYDAVVAENQNVKEDKTKLINEIRRLTREMQDKENKTTESFWQRSIAATRELHRVEEQLREAEEAKAALEKERDELATALEQTRTELAMLRERAEQVESERAAQGELQQQLKEAKLQLELLSQEHVAVSAQLAATQAELAQAKEDADVHAKNMHGEWLKQTDALRNEVSRLRKQLVRKHAETNGEDSQADRLDDSVAGETEALAIADAIDIREMRIRELERQLHDSEVARRKLHNKVQELRGNVRIFVRCRPFLPSDEEGGPSPVRCAGDNSSIVLVKPENGEEHNFTFDRVFSPSATQAEVYTEVSDFVQSALDGFKVCLFSYGQTGSGKTHTMTGTGTGNMRGIIPRAVEQILSRINELEQQEWQYQVEASVLEIYNEEVRDLLNPRGDDRDADKIKIVKDKDGNTTVTNTMRVTIDTSTSVAGLNQLRQVLARAEQARSMAATLMNAQSSRSHSIFILYLTGVHTGTNTRLSGVLYLVDLAGSERIDRSGVGSDAQRLRETVNINKSLSCLADVFTSLAQKNSHVPFRNSKLTFLLQDCLSGDGKALMFVNLSPTVASASETLCSLRFSKQVSQVELGKATRQISFASHKRASTMPAAPAKAEESHAPKRTRR